MRLTHFLTWREDVSWWRWSLWCVHPSSFSSWWWWSWRWSWWLLYLLISCVSLFFLLIVFSLSRRTNDFWSRLCSMTSCLYISIVGCKQIRQREGLSQLITLMTTFGYKQTSFNSFTQTSFRIHRRNHERDAPVPLLLFFPFHNHPLFLSSSESTSGILTATWWSWGLFFVLWQQFYSRIPITLCDLINQISLNHKLTPDSLISKIMVKRQN